MPWLGAAAAAELVVMAVPSAREGPAALLRTTATRARRASVVSAGVAETAAAVATVAVALAARYTGW